MADRRQSRRSILKGIGAASTATALGGALPAAVASSPERNRTVLGNFEDDLDGWTTNGGNELHRVQREERPFAVSRGSYGLNVDVQDDPYPVIENKAAVKRADFVGNPYSLATVTPSRVGDTRSTLTFKFRLHYSATGRDQGAKGKAGNEKKGSGNNAGNDAGQSSGKKPVLVKESEEMVVRPHVQRTLTWDMSGIGRKKLANAKRLEIGWYPTDHPPERGPRGKGPGYEYRGHALFDDIHITDDIAAISAREIAGQWEDYEQSHGRYEETVITSSTAEKETGKFVFTDGTEIAFSFVDEAEDRSVFEIDGESYRLGRGWK